MKYHDEKDGEESRKTFEVTMARNFSMLMTHTDHKPPKLRELKDTYQKMYT